MLFEDLEKFISAIADTSSLEEDRIYQKLIDAAPPGRNNLAAGSKDEKTPSGVQWAQGRLGSERNPDAPMPMEEKTPSAVQLAQGGLDISEPKSAMQTMQVRGQTNYVFGMVMPDLIKRQLDKRFAE